MRIGKVDTSKEVLIIAEIGNNHEGSFDVAMELVARAADTGVQAVKFQTFRTEHYVSTVQVEQFARLKKFQLDHRQFAKLADEAHKRDLVFISTPFDVQSARFLAGIVDAMKIASGDNTFYPLIETAAESGRSMIVSTGLATLADIHRAVGLIRQVWCSKGIEPGLALLHCVAAYPVPDEDANLAAVTTLARTFDATPGYSDHTLGTEAAVLSVAAGARVIEKHFTLATDYSDFRDHQLSADPRMMTELVRSVKHANILLGNGRKEPAKAEIANLQAMRRSIATAMEIKAGTLLEPRHITWVRPGDGFPPGAERYVLGRHVRRALGAGIVIKPEDLD